MLFAIAQVLVLAVLFFIHDVSAQTLADPLNLNATIREVKVDNAGGIRYEISAPGYSAFPLDPSMAYFGVRFINTSTALATWRDFMLNAVSLEEHIFYDYGNRSDDLGPATNYQWLVYDPQYALPLAYNISAIGRGLEPNTVVTLSWPRLVLFTRWMVQIARQPWANSSFECSFGLRGPPGQLVENVPVARGWYAPYKTPSSRGQEPPVLDPQGPQTS